MRLVFSDSLGLWVGLGLAIASAGLLWRRRGKLPSLSIALWLAGAILLAAAAGGVSFSGHDTPRVLVMVDLSGSTRTAQYRDARALKQRVAQLVGDAPFDIVAFGGGENVPIGEAAVLSDIRCQRTVFTPGGAETVLLFSDGRFARPASSGRIFCVVDPALESVRDAGVARLEVRGAMVAATIRNDGERDRAVRFSTAAPGSTTRASPGETVLTQPLAADERSASVAIAPGDAWPENDALAVKRPPHVRSERWWVNGKAGGRATAGMKEMRADELSTDESAWLAPSAVVLCNVAADELSPAARARLVQYVRDLGGVVIMLGGGNAFAAGGYEGTELDAVSPLASSPPAAVRQWIFLVDASGSMADASAAPALTLWDYEMSALSSALKSIPGEDAVSVAAFSREAKVWSTGQSARETARMRWPPEGAAPGGPTNLEPALKAMLEQVQGGLPTELLVMTDAQTHIADVAGLKSALLGKKVRLDVLAAGEGEAIGALRELCAASGGSLSSEFDSSKWGKALAALARSARGEAMAQGAIGIQFEADLAALGHEAATQMNHAWLKHGATREAAGRIDGKEEAAAAAARWSFGEGAVWGFAWQPSQETVEKVIALSARAPRDPRWKATITAAEMVAAAVDAVDGGKFLNGESFELEIRSEGSAHRSPLRQTSPGRYEVVVEAPREPAIVRVFHGAQVIEQEAIAGRYAPEFDAIGTDRQNLVRLARETGGAVIEPAHAAALDFNWGERRVGLAGWAAAAGALLLAGAMVRARLG